MSKFKVILKEEEKMSPILSEKVLKVLRCCIGSSVEHYCHDAYLLECGGNACKICIDNLHDHFQYRCRFCNQYHSKASIKMKVSNSNFQLLVEAYLNELKEILVVDLEQTKEAFTENQLNEELELRFQNVEFDLDVRIESIINDLHKYREKFIKEMQKMKEKYKKSLNIDDLNKMRSSLDALKQNGDFAADYTEFMKADDMLNQSKAVLQKYQNELKKIQFNCKPIYTLVPLKELVGDLITPLTIKIKSSKEINHTAECVRQFVYSENQKKVFLTDSKDNSLIIYDIEKNLPLKIQHYKFDSPNCLCLGLDDDLYVSNESNDVIILFNKKLEIKREFKINTYYISSIDFNDGLLYVAENDKITVWESESGLLNNETKIKASYLKVRNEFIYIMNSFESSDSDCNCIIILNKLNFEIIDKIDLADWLWPNGLTFDENDNIYTIANEFYNDKGEEVESEYQYLYLFNKNRKFVQNFKINDKFNCNGLISFEKNKIMMLMKDEIKIIEFEGPLNQVCQNK